MSFDPFANATDSLTSPAKHAFTITPHETEELPLTAKALYVGEGGSLVLRAVDSGEDVELVNVPSGTVLPIRTKAVRPASSAARIVGLS
ncbi:hypothetical protein D6201_08900 [Aurantiacibacter aquimixticola]|uniref:Uncharacterized protein n=2 Tax=Aurantiacibacter aquimixticola TaxID=1958945 RepID=A0A419RWY0_9SPHN|nr:hypothetical protein D6201_08900 [Aurantiacibacter aquimixticola]